jgi:hypothetical protein
MGGVGRGADNTTAVSMKKNILTIRTSAFTALKSRLGKQR